MQFILGFALAISMVLIFILGAFYGIYITEKEYKTKGENKMIYGNMKEHKYEVEGIKPRIMTEVTTLLHICCEKGLFTKDDVYKIAEMACKSNEEVHDDAMNLLTSTILDKIFEDASSGKQEAIDTLAMLTGMTVKDMRDKEQEE